MGEGGILAIEHGEGERHAVADAVVIDVVDLGI